MKINFKRADIFFLVIISSFILVSLPVYAALTSSTFLAKAQKFINNNCNEKHIDNQTSLNCYLFYKIGELEAKVNSNTSRITALENLPSPTPTASPSPVVSPSPQLSKEIKILDANNAELGIFVASESSGRELPGGLGNVVYIPSLDKFLRLNFSGTIERTDLNFTTSDCTGTEYGSIGDSTRSYSQNDEIFSSAPAKYYTANQPASAKTIFSFKSRPSDNTTETDGPCQFIAIGSLSSVVLLTPLNVTLPFADPVATPVHFKYQ